MREVLRVVLRVGTAGASLSSADRAETSKESIVDSIAPESIALIDPHQPTRGEPGATYLIGHFDEVRGERRFFVAEEFTSIEITLRAYKHLVEAPGPETNFEIAELKRNGRADW